MSKYEGEQFLAPLFTKKNAKLLAKGSNLDSKALKAQHKDHIRIVKEKFDFIEALLIQAVAAKAAKKDHFKDRATKVRYPTEGASYGLDEVIEQLRNHLNDCARAFENLANYRPKKSRQSNGLKRLMVVTAPFADFLRAAVAEGRFTTLRWPQPGQWAEVQVLTEGDKAALNAAILEIANGALVKGTKIRTLFSIYQHLNFLEFLAFGVGVDGTQVNNRDNNPGLINWDINDPRKAVFFQNYKSGYTGFDDVMTRTLSRPIIGATYTKKGAAPVSLGAVLGVFNDGAAVHYKRVPILLSQLLVVQEDLLIPKLDATGSNRGAIEAALARYEAAAAQADLLHQRIKAIDVHLMGNKETVKSGKKIVGILAPLSAKNLCAIENIAEAQRNPLQVVQLRFSKWVSDYNKKVKAPAAKARKSAKSAIQQEQIASRASALLTTSGLSAVQQQAVAANLTAAAAAAAGGVAVPANIAGGV